MNNRQDPEAILFPNKLFPILVHWNLKARTDEKPAWHECFEILYVMDGEIQVDCGYQRFICKKDDIFIINPCEEHFVTYQFGTPHYHCLMIDPKLYEGDTLDFCNLKYILSFTKCRVKVKNLIRNNPRVTEILNELLLEHKNQQYGCELMIKGDVLRLLAELFRNELSTLERNETVLSDQTNYALVAPVFSYIAEHYNQKITLDQLSKLCCISSPHLCRIFKKLTGKTVIYYLNEYRLSRVKLLLITSDMSIGKIAAEAGYPDERYMMRRFKTAYGVSPGAFRASYREERNEVQCNLSMI